MRVIAGCIVAALAAAPLRGQASTPPVAPASPVPQAAGKVAAPPAAALNASAELPPAAGAVRLLRRDGTTLAGALLALDGDALLLANAADASAPVRVPLTDLVSLEQGAAADGVTADSGAADVPAAAPRGKPGVFSAGTSAEPGPPDMLFLAPARAAAEGTSQAGRGGDRLVGRLLGGDAYGLRFQLAGTAPFDIPFESIERVVPHAATAVDRLALLPGAPTDDRLWRLGKDGAPDSLAGVVQSVSASEVVFEGAPGTLHFAWPDILALVFAPDAKPGPPLPGTGVAVRLRDGSRLEAGLLAWHDGRCTLATHFTPKLELPAASVVSLVRRDGALTLLADLLPTAVEQWPAFGTPADFLFPWRTDLSVSGQLLSVGGIGRATGLGVHSNARLSFLVPEGSTALLVSTGLCDEVSGLPATGSVSFEVRVDGALAAASGLLREGDAPRLLHVAGLHGGQSVELFTGDGGDDDAGDRAAWVDGVFVRGGD